MQSGSGYIGPFTTAITLTYRNVFTNIGNAYNPITGIFTAPLKGAYMFRVSAFGHAPTIASAAIVKNGQHVVAAFDHQAQNDLNSSNGVVLILEVGDVVYVRLWNGKRLFDNASNHNSFSGYLLFPLR
ncbi:complement C1q-like protein 4 [Megalobrama amblycephala]|uniref:complement C1q-like protein 4 n=1 Tax=Megalobrama amblycephala TaxID=75352 RepID=UPI002013DBBE|nr:complement C1q-like protein 4 [Megalobrama amblycephala]